MKIAYSNPNPDELHGNGSLFWLTFKVKGQPGQTTPLDLKEFIPGSGGSSIRDASRPLQNVPLRLTDGVFTVAAADDLCTLLGDVICDRIIRAQDAGFALRFAVGLLAPTVRQQHIADVNGNSKVDAPDATMILYRAVNPTFPLPPLAAAASAVQADPNVRLSSVQAQQGANVVVTLGADNLAGIAGGGFEIAYDPRVVERVVKVSNSGLASGFQAPAFRDSGAGLLYLAHSNATGISGTGNLLTIELKLRSGAPVGVSPLTLANARLNDPYGRDYVTGFANNSLTRQSGSITVASAKKFLYLPFVTKK